MHWKRWFLIGSLVLGLLATGTLSAVWARIDDDSTEYRFTLDRNLSHVIVNQDGSADIEYWLTFTCDPGAHEIDIVDVGLPNKSYDLDSAQAAFISPDGVESPLRDIRVSEWLDVGVEVHLREHSIQPGEQGTVYLRIYLIHCLERFSQCVGKCIEKPGIFSAPSCHYDIIFNSDAESHGGHSPCHCFVQALYNIRHLFSFIYK